MTLFCFWLFYYVGLRLVCNADDSVKGTVTTREAANTDAKKSADSGKALIIFYSWSGNTRGVAREIARQTGFDSIELELVKPYSTDYNTVLNQAQDDQHKQARLVLKTKIDIKKWAEYDTIILGYPNWWASLTAGLSIHYSGGSSLSKDVEKWLKKCRVK